MWLNSRQIAGVDSVVRITHYDVTTTNTWRIHEKATSKKKKQIKFNLIFIHKSEKKNRSLIKKKKLRDTVRTAIGYHNNS